MIGEPLAETRPVAPPTSCAVHVAVYSISPSRLPPFAPGVKVTTSVWSPRATAVIAGADGWIAATNELVDALAPAPMPLVALTVQEYVLPLVSESTSIDVAVSVTVCVAPPSLDVHRTV